MSTKLRIGQGYDVHRLVEGRRLILGGVDIPWTMGLLGHSDADVLVHAVIDALMGAAGKGDIGKAFPDNDPAFQDIDSMILLDRTMTVLRDAGYEPVNVDATIVAQRPKLAAYIAQMRRNLAQHMGLDVDFVSVKATTEEKLGFTGDSSGMAAQAVVLIEKVL